MSVSRRDLMKGAGGVLLGLGLGGVARIPDGIAAESRAGAAELPWPYKKLDPDTVAERGYEGYYKGACCYGAFDGIVGELCKEVGGPYNTFPTAMMVFGEGGVAGISTLCGALNGAAMAIFLTVGGADKEKKDRAFALIRELYNWYEQEPLPDYQPKKPRFQIVPSVSRSPLCHVSVTNWCKVSKVKSFSKERAERCAWLTGSVARRAVLMLNDNAVGAFKATHPIPAAEKMCRSCHDQGGVLENSRGLMDCGGCHFTSKTKHPKT
ncbi:MAG: C-GCAxxG-C-C family protein [Syntrophorhabdales bacterium]|jgi:C_GCAxxG_C_C family probable redox protein